MASKPGPLYSWPWEDLGNMKYLVLIPLMMHHFVNGWADEQQARFNDHMLTIAFLRYAQMFIWQFLSRYNPVSGRTRIQKKNIEFEQLDREEHWDDYILLQALLISVLYRFLPGFREMPVFDWRGMVAMLLVHMGPIEFVYYWFHRALHHDFLWQQYHSHHHSSFVTEPISGTVHPFLENFAYTAIFSASVLIPYLMGLHCLACFYTYGLAFDFMNALGHCNFEFLPSFFMWSPIKYLVYTPSYHSLHHSRVHTNYCLFMPIYDKVFGTYCSESEKTYTRAINTKSEDVPSPDVIFLAHGGPLGQILQIPFISKTVSAHKFEMQWWMYPIMPLIMAMVPLLELFGTHFENASAYIRREVGLRGNSLRALRAEQWAIARFAYHYVSKSHKASIAKLIEGAVLDADRKGCQVMGLGAFNKAWWINKGGDDVVNKYPQLRMRLVHGNTLTAACVLNSLPPCTKHVFFTGCTSKVGRALAVRLAIEGKIVIMRTDSQERFDMIVEDVKKYDIEGGNAHENLVKANSMKEGAKAEVWLIGKFLKDVDHKFLPPKSLALYFCFPPPRTIRKDVTYVNVGALQADSKRLEGLGNCMADLDRNVLHACHAGAIIHCLEQWQHHEVGDVEYKELDRVWEAACKYGFRLPEESTKKILTYLHKHPRAGSSKKGQYDLQISIERAAGRAPPSSSSSLSTTTLATTSSSSQEAASFYYASTSSSSSSSTSSSPSHSPDRHSKRRSSSSRSGSRGAIATKSNNGSRSSKAEDETRCMNDSEIKACVDKGEALLIVDGWVVNATTFATSHPGGEAIINRYAGKDASVAMHGRIYNHSKAAFNIVKKRRIAKYRPSSSSSSTTSSSLS